MTPAERIARVQAARVEHADRLHGAGFGPPPPPNRPSLGLAVLECDYRSDHPDAGCRSRRTCFLRSRPVAMRECFACMAAADWSDVVGGM